MGIKPLNRKKFTDGRPHEGFPIQSLIRQGNGTGVLPAFALLLHKPEDSSATVDHRIKTGINTLLEADPFLDKSILDLFTDASVSAINSEYEHEVGSIASGLAELKNSGADEKICKLFTDASVSAINSGNGHRVGDIARGLAELKKSGADEKICKLFTDASASAIKSGKEDSVGDIASGLAFLKKRGADEKICKLFTDASVSVIKSGKGNWVDTIRGGLAQLKNSGADEKICKLFTDALVLLINSEDRWLVFLIAKGLAKLKNSGADETIWKLFTDASASAINSGNGNWVGSIASGLAFLKADFASIELENLSRRVSLLDTRELLSALADIIVRSELIYRSQGKEDRILPYFLSLDQHPWSVEFESEKVQAAFKQTAEIMLGSIRRSRSSIHEAYSARRILAPDYKRFSQYHSQYEEFLDWLKVNNLETYAGNWAEEKFPGNGWSFEGFEPSSAVKNYVSAMTAWEPQVINPQEKINSQQALERSKSIFDDLVKSSIYKLRGALIIKPKSNNYLLESATCKEQYSCIFYNDHYDNLANATSIMIPTRVLEAEIAKEGGLNNLRSGLLVKHPEALVFSSNSVFGGGLTNARQPKSSPLFDWESLSQDETNDKDLAGHVHKSHIGGAYNTDWNSLVPELGRFRQDHLNIYEIMNRFQIMTCQLDVLESLHVKGYSNDNREETNVSSDQPSEESVPDITTNASRLCEAWKLYISKKVLENPTHSPLIVDASVLDKDTIVADWTIAYDPYNDKYYKNKNGVPGLILQEVAEHNWSETLKNPNRTIRVLPLSSVEFKNKENK